MTGNVCIHLRQIFDSITVTDLFVFVNRYSGYSLYCLEVLGYYHSRIKNAFVYGKNKLEDIMV